MKVYAEVLTAPSADTPGTTILLHFDSKKYVFGQLSEGTQRAFMERHVRLNKVSNVFLTGPVQWSNTAGLAGLILALGEAHALDLPGGKQQGLSVHGGENLLYSLSTMRRFVFRTGMSLAVKELVPGLPEFRDENLVVRTLHILPSGMAGRARDGQDKKAFLGKAVNDMFCSDWNMNTFVDDVGAEEGVEPEHNPQLSTKLPPKGKTRPPWPASTIKSLPDTTPSTVAISYVVQLHEQRGKFLPALAKKLGIKPGPDFSKLTSGQSVTTAEGKVVNPEDVMEPSREGTGIAICDIPSLAYLPNFLAAAPEWENMETAQRTIGCFFWLTTGEVVGDPRYLAFVGKFPKSRHIISSADICPDRITFKGTAKSAVLLNSLDAELFSEPKLDCTPRRTVDPSKFEIAAPGLQWQIEPKWQLRTETVEPLFHQQEVVKSDGYKALAAVAEECRQNISAPEVSDLAGKEVEIFTLGTGSSLPSRHRNVSSTLVRIPEVGSMLLDCGEGTLGQLRRLFPQQGGAIEDILSDIKLIYVSHLHADHHLGCTSILSMKHSLQPNHPIFVLGPEVFYTWLNEYSSAEPEMAAVMANVVFIPSEDLESEALPRLLEALSLSKIETAPAIHCLSSFTVAFTFDLSDGTFKLSYSGDTRPNPAFVAIGKDSTVLIHEATFEDDMAAQARAKKHSTVGEALNVAREMGAGAVVLTHFSQRYPKIAAMSDGEEGANVVLAFDGARIRVRDMARFRALKRGLEVIYSEEEVAGGQQKE
ncbi:beta-lactamase-like protein [Sphaerosporella brunnea]|uniref:ribonuclease Z n=1 Tax=Sphaerosporella brunnea TaxID=1250544 RepID=A0A5J5ECP4_9PEZI|nr:beta-lactamase-like protein [Sphaerosporella brunnea]